MGMPVRATGIEQPHQCPSVPHRCHLCPLFPLFPLFPPIRRLTEPSSERNTIEFLERRHSKQPSESRGDVHSPNELRITPGLESGSEEHDWNVAVHVVGRPV